MKKVEWETLAQTKPDSPVQNTLLDKTQEEDEHPEWYKGPCMCQSCQGDPADDAPVYDGGDDDEDVEDEDLSDEQLGFGPGPKSD